jgi:heptosyltransferase II
MKVLVIQIKMIGDVLASTVICEAIKTKHPDWEVHYMIQPNTLAVVENHPAIDKIVFFDPKEHKGINNLFAFGKRLKAENYSMVIDAYTKWESIIPTYFSGAKVRVGQHKWYTQIFYTKTVKLNAKGNGTAITNRLYLAEVALNEKVTAIYPNIHLTLDEKLDTTKTIIMMSILGSGINKSLPPNSMAKVMDEIVKDCDIQLLLNYIPNQLKDVKEIYDLCLPATQEKIAFDFYAESLRDFMGLVTQCDALIGNEGGATNMAKALQIPTFTIYAPWINKKSWNIMEDTGFHDVVHLEDYFPELYNNQHPKKFKDKALDWYQKLKPELFATKLEQFVTRIRK